MGYIFWHHNSQLTCPLDFQGLMLESAEEHSWIVLYDSIP